MKLRRRRVHSLVSNSSTVPSSVRWPGLLFPHQRHKTSGTAADRQCWGAAGQSRRRRAPKCCLPFETTTWLPLDPSSTRCPNISQMLAKPQPPREIHNHYHHCADGGTEIQAQMKAFAKTSHRKLWFEWGTQPRESACQLSDLTLSLHILLKFVLKNSNINNSHWVMYVAF